MSERPDKPGVWFRDGECWRIVSATYEGMTVGGLAAAKWDEGSLRCPVSELPPGNWSPAVPAARVSELEAENERLRSEILANLAVQAEFRNQLRTEIAGIKDAAEIVGVRAAAMELENERLRELLRRAGCIAIIDGRAAFMEQNISGVYVWSHGAIREDGSDDDHAYLSHDGQWLSEASYWPTQLQAIESVSKAEARRLAQGTTP